MDWVRYNKNNNIIIMNYRGGGWILTRGSLPHPPSPIAIALLNPLRHPYLKIFDLASLFVADAPMKKLNQEIQFHPPLRTLGSENRPWVRRLNKFFYWTLFYLTDNMEKKHMFNVGLQYHKQTHVKIDLDPTRFKMIFQQKKFLLQKVLGARRRSVC